MVKSLIINNNKTINNYDNSQNTHFHHKKKWLNEYQQTKIKQLLEENGILKKSNTEFQRQSDIKDREINIYKKRLHENTNSSRVMRPVDSCIKDFMKEGEYDNARKLINNQLEYFPRSKYYLDFLDRVDAGEKNEENFFKSDVKDI